MAKTKAKLIRRAAAQVAAYPQYAGHFKREKGWVLVRMARSIRTKMGMAFEKGEVTIAHPTEDPGEWTAWSFSHGIDTSVWRRDLIVLEGFWLKTPLEGFIWVKGKAKAV